MGRLIKILQTYGGLPKSIYALFVARIINRLGGFVHSFLTLFLTIHLGMNEKEIGFYVAMSGLASLAGTLIGGKLGDQISRKKVYILAQTIAALLLVPCGFLLQTIWVPRFLIASTLFGAMVRPVGNAMVMDIVDKKERKKAFSLLYLGINFGTALGPILGGFLFNHYLQWLFLGDALTTLVSLIFVVRYVPETILSKTQMSQKNMGVDKQEQMEHGSAIIALLKRPLLCTFALFGLLNGFVYAQSAFGLSLQLKTTFGETLASVYYGSLFSFNAVIVLVFTVFITYITRKNAPVLNIAIASLLYAFGFGMMRFIDTLPLFFISVAIWTLGEILAVTNHGVFVTNHTPISHRGRFSAILNIIEGSGHTFGPIIAGWFISGYGMRNLWLLVGAIAVIACLGFFSIYLVESKSLLSNKSKKEQVRNHTELSDMNR